MIRKPSNFLFSSFFCIFFAASAQKNEYQQILPEKSNVDSEELRTPENTLSTKSIPPLQDHWTHANLKSYLNQHHLYRPFGPRSFVINTFSLDTRYLNRKSSQASYNFILEALGLYGLIFSDVSESITAGQWWARILFFFIPGALTKYINIATNVSCNQFGRNRAERSLGYDVYAGQTPRNDYDKLVIWCAGVNSQMDLARNLAQKTYRYNNTFVNFTAYIFGKVAAHYYLKKPVKNKMDEILEMPVYKKLKIGKNNTQFASGLSLFVSSGFYSYLWGIWNYIVYGTYQIKPIEIGGILLPEISYYFTTRGLSYLIESAYRLDETCYIPFSIEFVPSDDTYDEFTIGIAKHMPDFYNITTELRLRVGRRLSGDLSLNYPLTHNTEFSGGVSLFNRNSPYGERNSPNLASQKPYAMSFWLKISLVFS
jgi:hypothetical protein